MKPLREPQRHLLRRVEQAQSAKLSRADFGRRKRGTAAGAARAKSSAGSFLIGRHKFEPTVDQRDGGRFW